LLQTWLRAAKEALLAVDLALFVSKRLMPVAAALLLLATARLACDQARYAPASPARGAGAVAQSTEVRVVIAR
jgi:hypothetical protein